MADRTISDNEGIVPPATASTRQQVLQTWWEFAGSRRAFLGAAAAAGLIPVLTQDEVSARESVRKAAQNAQPVQGGTFVAIAQDTIESLSPEDASETAQWVVVSQLFDGLYTINESYELVPVLADSYEASVDGKTYTFKLKSGVTFHNGDPFSAADVKYTYDWIRDPKNASTRAGLFAMVDRVEAPDPTTLVVKLREADVTFMVNVAPTFIYPAKAHAALGEDAFKATPVGTGPFVLKEWVPAQHTLMAVNDAYFRGRANLAAVRIDVVPEAAARAAALESGVADNSIWSLNAEDAARLRDSGDFRVYETLQNATNHFALNNTPPGGERSGASSTVTVTVATPDARSRQPQPFLSEKAVRQALLLALDRESLANDIFKGQAQVATGNLSPNLVQYYNPDVATYPYDPDKARQILDEAGWTLNGDVREKAGQKAAFTLTVFQGDTQRRPEAELAQQWWKEIGVEVTLQEGIASDTLAGMVEGRLQAALFNWPYGGSNGDPDARDTLGSMGANNFNNFRNAEVDDLLQQGIVEQDPARRIDIYRRVQEIVAEEVPFLFLLNLKDIVFYRNRVKGLPETVLAPDNLYPQLFKFWLT